VLLFAVESDLIFQQRFPIEVNISINLPPKIL
jgi:hypothetical protein